ncbi:hypothetical protein DSCO28_55230 [Desulfosarcina ovata subsp. sediminis]|uniref:Leucine-binding protein domain-containing protein n=1 Tax=Desulfosarcina ovata subsp. sediminis TaxID=885957 RepID=A0A5K7ZXH2_9BACT|nr:hypothetical protein [Desulfosarcina ovata]BBO84957.1 hypothetical protein DSCO28_55230 [Desulfosarcina ovata subsp. sediminis]
MQNEFGTPIKKLAFVYENGDWGKGFAAQWKKLAQDGGYEVVKFDKTGQNANASLVMVQINDIGGGLERITCWPKNARRAGYTPVFPKP